MKRIDAIIQPHSLNVVKDHLILIGVDGLTIKEARGFGRQKGHTEVYRGTEYSVDLLPKLLLTVLASDDRVESIIEAIVAGSRSGNIGDGKIFITPVDEVIRIRSGQRGETAI